MSNSRRSGRGRMSRKSCLNRGPCRRRRRRRRRRRLFSNTVPFSQASGGTLKGLRWANIGLQQVRHSRPLSLHPPTASHPPSSHLRHCLSLKSHSPSPLPVVDLSLPFIGRSLPYVFTSCPTPSTVSTASPLWLRRPPSLCGCIHTDFKTDSETPDSENA